jgi:glycosyltransferase involved in cell wall biosynthesis
VLMGLAAYLRRTRPDVIMSGIDPANVIAVLASTMAGVRSRCVISQRAVIRDVYRLERPRTWRAWLWLLGLTYRRARLVICNSSAAAEEVVQQLNVDPSRVAVVINSVDVDRIRMFASHPVEDSWIGDTAVPLIVSVGSLSKRKDMGTLLRAVARVRRMRQCNLVILGEGPERRRLEELARELGIENAVRLPGFAVNPFPWIMSADVFVSASLAEGCPNVIQQALACGTPIVATDCPGGTAEVLEHGRWGRLVPTRDPEAMATAIVAAFDDADPPNGRVRAASFERRATANRYLQLLVPNARLSSAESWVARNTQSIA